MKKTVILVLTLALVLGISWCAQAGVYLESMLDGSGEAFDEDVDVSATIIGFDQAFDSYKIGLEYITGTWEDTPWGPNGDIDFSAYEVKLGYDFLKGDETRLYATISYFNYEYDDLPVEASGILLGIELNHYFNESSLIEASAAFSVNGEIDLLGDSLDADVLLAKLRYTYYFTDNFGLNIGYRYYKVEDEDDDEFLSDGFTAGLSFKF